MERLIIVQKKNLNYPKNRVVFKRSVSVITVIATQITETPIAAFKV